MLPFTGLARTRRATRIRSAEEMSDRLIVFTRSPQPGLVKTRLFPSLGPGGAVQLHIALTRRMLQTAEQFCRQSPFALEVRVADGALADMQSLYGDRFTFIPQTGSDLGERLGNSVTQALESGAERVLVVGTDCPELTPALLDQAAAALESADVVIGPALDGGYYLIGVRTAHAELFEAIDWGTGVVREQTLAAAKRLGLTVKLLPLLSDIDEPQDLVVWRRVVGAIPGTEPPIRDLLSIVIPTLNEADGIAATVHSLLVLPDLEVIVADGGSRDNTAEIARQLGVRVVISSPGRGRQMNAGAAVARGGRLLFLHADTQLPENFREHMESVLGGGACAGAFRLRIDGDRRAFRWIEWGANARSRLLQLPYGDQALFLPAELFYRLGGFAELALMEDVDLCRRLRHCGRIALAAAEVRTSARRWERLGPVRTTVMNQLYQWGYWLGVPATRLARWYMTGPQSDAARLNASTPANVPASAGPSE